MSENRASPAGISVWLLYLATVVTGGLTWFVTTYQLGTVAYGFSLAYRFGISAIILLLIAGLAEGLVRIRVVDHFLIALQGVLIFYGSFSLIYLGLEHLTSGLVALLFSSVLIFNVVNSAVFLRRPLSAKVALGAVLGTSGLILVFAPAAATLSFDHDGTRGIVVVIGAALLFSVGNMLSARLQSGGVPALQATGLAMAYGALCLAVMAGLTGPSIAFDPGLPYVLSLLYLAVFGSVVGYGAYFVVVGRLGPERAAYAIVMTPVFALVISTALEGFDWGPRVGAGVAVVVVGNILVLSRQGSTPIGTGKNPTN